MAESRADAAGNSDEQFLELANVNVARGDRVVLHDINLTIRHRRACCDSGAEWVRQVDADLHHHMPDLSHGAAGDAGAHLRARAMGPDAIAQAFWRGWRGADGRGAARRTDRGDDGIGCGDCRILFSVDAVAESACDRGDARARCGGAGAHGGRAPGQSTGGRDVGGGENGGS